jgi:hypothetical protein
MSLLSRMQVMFCVCLSASERPSNMWAPYF